MPVSAHEPEPAHLGQGQLEFSMPHDSEGTTMKRPIRPSKRTRIPSGPAEAEINKLPPDEAALLRLRFGLRQRPQTLAEVAATLGLTLREARRLEARALQRLRWLSVLMPRENDWDEI